MGSNLGKTSTNDHDISPEGMFITVPEDLRSVHDEAVGAIERAVRDAGAEGAVVAMSGGIDSTLTAALSREALGEDRVLGLGLPSTKTEATDGADARTIAEGLGIDGPMTHIRSSDAPSYTWPAGPKRGQWNRSRAVVG